MSTANATYDVFHEGELAVQARAGSTAQGQNSGRMIAAAIIPGAIKFVGKQPFFVTGSVDEQQNVWASIVVGQTGFMSAEPRTLDVDLSAAIGNEADPLWQNLAGDSRIGILVIDLRTRARLRVNGRVSFPTTDVLHVDVEQAYPNCPQYIQRRNYRPTQDQNVRPQVAVGAQLTAEQQRWIASADTLFVASAHPDGGVDASHRGGAPGFAKVVGTNRLRIPDYSGNGMFNTLGNFAADARAGIVIPDFEQGRTLQMTGTVEVHWQVDDPHNETGGTGRWWEFEVQRWVQIDHSLPGATEFLDYSPHNPVRTD